LKVTFLGSGTSQGVPVIACCCKVCKSDDIRDNRLRSSLLVEVGESKIIIDAGPDFRQQVLREGVTTLDAILLTHEHKDHIGGIDDVRAFNYISKKPIDIYCDKRVDEVIRREYPYVFSENRYPGAPMMNLHSIPNTPFELLNITITPIEVSHYWLPVYGFRIGDLAYITDANSISDMNFEKLKGVKYFIINALRKDKHISHYNLEGAIDLIRRVKPEIAYLTHVGHQMGLYKEVSRLLPEGVFLAYDGLSFEC
jgi:phosphoribosyl 1,2-cyclic phosphate phosphodiesterase